MRILYITVYTKRLNELIHNILELICVVENSVTSACVRPDCRACAVVAHCLLLSLILHRSINRMNTIGLKKLRNLLRFV